MTSNAGIPSTYRILGLGKDKSFILSSICLVLVSFFYFFVVASGIQTKIYTFQYRVTYEQIFLTHVSSLGVDALVLLSATVAWIYLSMKAGHMKHVFMIFFSVFLVMIFTNVKIVSLVGAALTLPFVICLIILDRFRCRVSLRWSARLSYNYVIIWGILLASSGITSLFLHITAGITTVTVEQYAYAIYQQFPSILTPIIMAALVFCLPLKVILMRFINKMKDAKLLFDIVEDKLGKKQIVIFLILCVILAMGVSLIAHLPTINPNSERLGVDTPRYVDWLNHMQNQTADPIYFVLKGDRPLTLIMLFLMTQATKADPFQVAEYSPTFFTPLLVLVTFFLVRQLTANDKISLISSFLSAISFQTLIGIYSGFYANWLALILGYLSFGLLVRCLKHLTIFNIIMLVLVMTGTLLAHTQTWSVVIAVALAFLFVLHVLNYYPRKHFLVIYLVISSSIGVDLLKSSWTGSSTGMEVDISIGLSHGLGISQFNERLSTLADTVQTYYGGVYANIAILGLAMYWLILSQPRQPVNIFLLIFMSTALIPLFIGDYVLQSRVLYEIPFQIPAAISLYIIAKKNGKIFFIGFLLITVYLSFHVLANLGYVPPTNPLSIIQK